MQRKKILSAAVLATILVNAGIASLAFADSGSATIGNGTTSAGITDIAGDYSGGTLTFGGYASNLCDGVLAASFSTQEACAIVVYTVQDQNSTANETKRLTTTWSNATQAGVFYKSATESFSMTDGTTGMQLNVFSDGTYPHQTISPTTVGSEITAWGGSKNEYAQGAGSFSNGTFSRKIFELVESVSSNRPATPYLYTDAHRWSITIPAGTPAGTYTATVTYTFA